MAQPNTQGVTVFDVLETFTKSQNAINNSVTLLIDEVKKLANENAQLRKALSEYQLKDKNNAYAEKKKEKAK